MKHGLFILCICLCLSCDKKTSPVNTDTTNPPVTSGYIEYEPSIASDRLTITLIRADSANVSNKNGLYKAPLVNPVREEVLLKEQLHSPTRASTNKYAYLQTNRIVYYSTATDTSIASQISQSFSKIIFLNDSILIGEYASNIYIINTKSDSVLESFAGSCPALYARDTAAVLKPIATFTYALELITFEEAGPIPKLTLDSQPIDTLFSTARPLSLGIEPVSKRYCYSIAQNQQFLIITDEPGSLARNEIADSKYSTVSALSLNKFLYSGEDGRLYETDFKGTLHKPFWGNLDSDI